MELSIVKYLKKTLVLILFVKEDLEGLRSVHFAKFCTRKSFKTTKLRNEIPAKLYTYRA